MPIFPRIQSPCPYKSDLAAVMDGDMCRMCKRNVFDLTAMDDGERLAFLAGCEEEVCVSYRIPMRAALAAAALAASAPAFSQEVAAPAMDDVAVSDAVPYDESFDIIVGGIKDPKKVEMVEIDTDASVPELPIVYEDEATPAAIMASAGPAGT
ncbi:MAG TPA: hypothetical protein VE053_03265 [Allosphingosinicella sp.]|nr:hypothetical protein [Allosphingosinicella sp.]